MWHSTCEGLRTCCNDGGICGAFGGGTPPPEAPEKHERESRPAKARPRSPSPESMVLDESGLASSKCEWPFGCPYSCADPGPEKEEEPLEDPTHGWGALIEKDPPELEPYNPPVPCGIGYPCGYRSRGKMYMPGGPGQVGASRGAHSPPSIELDNSS